MNPSDAYVVKCARRVTQKSQDFSSFFGHGHVRRAGSYDQGLTNLCLRKTTNSNEPREWMMFCFRNYRSNYLVMRISHAACQSSSGALDHGFKDRGHLLGRFALAVNEFRHTLSQA